MKNIKPILLIGISAVGLYLVYKTIKNRSDMDVQDVELDTQDVDVTTDISTDATTDATTDVATDVTITDVTTPTPITTTTTIPTKSGTTTSGTTIGTSTLATPSQLSSGGGGGGGGEETTSQQVNWNQQHIRSVINKWNDPEFWSLSPTQYYMQKSGTKLTQAI